MEININIEDYLSEAEIKNICEETIANIIWEKYGNGKSDIDMLITNLAYKFVWKMIDECIDGNLDELIKTNVIRVIEGLSEFSVFRPKERWDMYENVGYNILCKEIIAARPLIKARVEKIIEEYPFRELKHDEIGDVIYDCIMDKLFNEKER